MTGTRRMTMSELPNGRHRQVYLIRCETLVYKFLLHKKEFGINELCRTVGLSGMQVHRKLKAITAMPATQFLHMVRLQKAIQLRKETDLNVSEVAYKVGFSDHSYFIKPFVQQFGKTPTEIIMNR